MSEHMPITNTQPVDETPTTEVSEQEQALSPEHKRAIIEAVNSELAQEMARLHHDEPFHNEGHLEDVGGDAAAILEIFRKYGMSDESDELAAGAAANGHDLIIQHTIVTDKAAFNHGQRVRHRGFGEMMPANVKALGVEKGNEELSWEKTLEVINRIDPNREVYTDKVLEKIRNCIAATYPDAYPATLPEGATSIIDPTSKEEVDLSPYLQKNKDTGKPEAFKFDQPFLNAEGADLSTLAVAFGDLMYGGKCTSEDFVRHGNDEYQEINDLIVEEIRGGVDRITPERKAAIAKSMTAWIGTQVGFLLWQKVRFEEILNTFKPIVESAHADDVRKDLRGAYRNFDQNLIATKTRIEESTKRFAALKDSEFYKTSPDIAQDLFSDLLVKMGIPTKE